MNRPILVCALFLIATAALRGQDASQPSPYQGTSTPPPDDTIVTTNTPQAKPPAGQPAVPAEMQVQTQVQAPSQAASANPDVNSSDPDGGIVQVEQNAPAPEQPALTARGAASDPDGDIVHPQPLRPGELGEGTTIRVELLDRLSTTSSEKGQTFRSRVATDVLQGGQVLIPAGAEIDGRVAEVSSGHAGGRGSMRLQPETVILPNGSRYMLHADVTGTPGSRTRVGSEGAILPASRLKRDGIEYGGAVGGGAITGAIVGGPVGALTGGLIGAGAVTAHLLINHPQATLEPGTVLIFSLSEPLLMAPEGASGN
jgi:hypothetical protein